MFRTHHLGLAVSNIGYIDVPLVWRVPDIDRHRIETDARGVGGPIESIVVDRSGYEVFLRRSGHCSGNEFSDQSPSDTGVAIREMKNVRLVVFFSRRRIVQIEVIGARRTHFVGFQG